jgi:hypothetical protein
VRRVIANPIILMASILFALYLVLASFIPPSPLLEHIRLLQMSTAIAVVIAYSPFAFSALRESRRPDRVQQLSMGILLGFLSIMLGGLWSYVWRTSGKPAWMYDSDVQGFIIWISILAAALHITAPGAIDGQIPKRNFIMLGCAVGIGVFLAGLTVSFNPDLRDIAAVIEPWLSDHTEQSWFGRWWQPLEGAQHDKEFNRPPSLP